MADKLLSYTEAGERIMGIGPEAVAENRVKQNLPVTRRHLSEPKGTKSGKMFGLKGVSENARRLSSMTEQNTTQAGRSRVARLESENSDLRSQVAALRSRLDLAYRGLVPVVNADEFGAFASSSIGLLFRLSWISPACVYFLTSGREVVYVGQTNCLLTRIAAHVRKIGDQFDSIYYVCPGASKLLAVEAALIAYFKPRLNAQRPNVSRDEAAAVVEQFGLRRAS